jgi:hypothetical protein
VSTLNPARTIIVPLADIPWKVPDVAPPNSEAEATLGGGEQAVPVTRVALCAARA